MLHVELGQQFNKPIVLCLGYFGAVHLGHKFLFDTAKKIADDNGCLLAVFTFNNDVLQGIDKHNVALFTYEERLSTYEDLGVDCVVTAEFDNALMSTRGADFLSKIALLHPFCVVCGSDYTFGSDLCNALDVKKYFDNVCIVEQLCDNGCKISTSRIIECIKNNDVVSANKLLYKPYFISGVVVNGRHVGTSIGFPTANIEVSNNKLLPCGVFGGFTFVDGVKYNCVVNIGAKPTFDESSTTVEAHIIGFDGNLYGKVLTVSLTKYIRPIVKFDQIDQLVAQINADVEIAND